MLIEHFSLLLQFGDAPGLRVAFTAAVVLQTAIKIQGKHAGSDNSQGGGLLLLPIPPDNTGCPKKTGISVQGSF